MHYSEKDKKLILRIREIINSIQKKDFYFEDIFKIILESQTRDIGVIITENSFKLQIPKEKNKVEIENYFIQLVLLLFKLKKENLLVFIEVSNNYANEFKYNEKSNFPKKTIYLGENGKEKEVLKILYSKVYMSSEIEDIIKNNFENNETKNLRYTRIALWTNIFFLILGLFYQGCVNEQNKKLQLEILQKNLEAQYDIARNINTVIEFAKPEDLQKNINSEIHIINHAPLELKHFSMPKTH